MTRLLTWSARAPWLSLGAFLLLSAVLAIAAIGVRPRYAIEDFFPEGTPDRVTYEREVALFGRDDRTGYLIAVSDGPLGPRAFGRLQAVTRRLELRDDLERVVSPTNVRIPVRHADGNVVLERALPADLAGDPSPERVAELRRTFAQPPYRGALLSDDGTVAVVAAVLEPEHLDHASRARLLDGLAFEATRLEAEAGLTCHLAGYPLHRVRLARLSASESRRLLPLVLLVILGFGLLAFRSWTAALLPVAVAAAATVWTTGVLGLVGSQPNIFGPAVYVLIAVVGVADAVHLLARQRELRAEGLAPRLAAEQALAEVGPACFLASLTTAVAFASLALTSLPLVAAMGLQVALGVGVAFVITLLLFPVAALRVSPPAAGAGGGRLTRFALATDAWVAARPRAVVAGFGVAFLIALALAGRVRINARLLEDLPPDHPVRQANQLLEARLDGVIPLDLLIEPPTSDDPLAPYARGRLERVEQLTARLRKVPGVLRATSIVDPLRRLGALLEKVPPAEVPGLVPTALLLAPEHVTPWVAEGARVLRIRLRIADLDIADSLALFGRIRDLADDLLPGEAVTLTGQGYLAQTINRDIVLHFRSGFLAALLAVGLLLLLWSRRPALALAALAVNLFPVVVVAGLLGLLDINLRYTTALVLSVVFGLAVDDTIHVVAQLRRRRDDPDPIRSTYRVSGPGLVLTSLLLAVGFSVLLFATFVPLRLLGGLLAATAAVALAADMLLLPALLRLRAPTPPAACEAEPMRPA